MNWTSGMDSLARQFPWHLVMEVVARDPEPLRSVRSRCRDLASLAGCCRATAGDVRRFGYVPLAEEYVRAQTRQDVDALVGMDLALTSDWNAIQTASRLKVAAVVPEVCCDVEGVRAALVGLQRRCRTLPEALMLQVETHSYVMTAKQARTSYLLRAREFRGRRSVLPSDAQDACLLRYGDSAGLEKERARRSRIVRERRTRDEIRLLEFRAAERCQEMTEPATST